MTNLLFASPSVLGQDALAPWVLTLGAPGLDRLTFFGFEVHVSVLVGCLYLAGVYALMTGPARKRYGWDDPPPSAWRKASWYFAVGLIFFALNGPLHEFADEYLFSAHMVQHMLLMIIMPPFLILGLPPWLIRRALDRPRVRRVAGVLTNPFVAYTLYNVVFIGWHFPDAYNLALSNHAWHIIQHLMFMSVAVMMWWPVIRPVDELNVIPDGPLLMMYVFAFGVPSTAVAAFITLSDNVIYPWYDLAARVTSLTAHQDQRLGGLIMWVPGMLLFWVAITFVFFRWSKDEYADW